MEQFEPRLQQPRRYLSGNSDGHPDPLHRFLLVAQDRRAATKAVLAEVWLGLRNDHDEEESKSDALSNRILLPPYLTCHRCVHNAGLSELPNMSVLASNHGVDDRDWTD